MTVNKPSLEDRYRRILRLYPADHRRDHEDEMIGVLLADDRTRPDLRDVCDLVWGALLIRLRRATGTFSEERWRDAFAIVGIIAPILLIGLSLRPLASNVGFFLRDMHGAKSLHSAEFLAEEELLWLAFGAVAILALLGVRRVGTVAAFALPAVTIGLMFSSYGGLSWQASTGGSELPVVLSLLTGVALWASPQGRHRLAPTGPAGAGPHPARHGVRRRDDRVADLPRAAQRVARRRDGGRRPRGRGSGVAAPVRQRDVERAPCSPWCCPACCSQQLQLSSVRRRSGSWSF